MKNSQGRGLPYSNDPSVGNTTSTERAWVGHASREPLPRRSRKTWSRRGPFARRARLGVGRPTGDHLGRRLELFAAGSRGGPRKQRRPRAVPRVCTSGGSDELPRAGVGCRATTSHVRLPRVPVSKRPGWERLPALVPLLNLRSGENRH